MADSRPMPRLFVVRHGLFRLYGYTIRGRLTNLKEKLSGHRMGEIQISQ